MMTRLNGVLAVQSCLWRLDLQSLGSLPPGVLAPQHRKNLGNALTTLRNASKPPINGGRRSDILIQQCGDMPLGQGIADADIHVKDLDFRKGWVAA
jgi:hypothetical protein